MRLKDDREVGTEGERAFEREQVDYATRDIDAEKQIDDSETLQLRGIREGYTFGEGT